MQFSKNQILILISILVSILNFGFYNIGPQITKLKYHSIGVFARGSNSWVSGKTFFAGVIDGAFSTPKGVAIDAPHDRLYVANSTKYSVDKYVLSTGMYIGSLGYSLIATGTCLSGLQSGWCSGGTFATGGSYDGAFTSNNIAIDSTHDSLYVIDNGSHRIHKFTASTGAFIGSIGNSTASGTCIAGKQNGWCTGGVFSSGSGDGMFMVPDSIAVNSTDNTIYISDTGNNRIQKLTTNGAFVGAIGNSTASGTCIAGKQNGWCTGGVFSSGTGDGMFNTPKGIAVDPSGNNLLIADNANHRVIKFDLSTGAFIGTIGNSTASGTCIAGKQNGWCTGGVFSSGTGDGMFNQPIGVTFDSTTDSLIVSEKGNSRIQKFTYSTGAQVGIIGNSTFSGTCIAGSQTSWCTGGSFSSGSGDGMFWGLQANISADVTNGFFYVAETSNYRVQKFNISTGAFAGSIGAITDTTTTWTQFNSNPAVFGNAPAYSNNFFQLYGVAVDTTNDKLYISSTYSQQILKFNLTTGVYIGSIGNSTASGSCIAGKQNNWCTGGVFSSGTGDGMFSNPGGIELDITNDFLYVSDIGNNRVQKFIASTGAFVGAIGKSTASGTCIAGKQNSWCTGGVFSSGTGDGMIATMGGIALDKSLDALYVLSNQSRIEKFTASTGAFVGSIGYSSAAGTCIAGKQNGWCTGGSFGMINADGGFMASTSIAINSTNHDIFVGDSAKIQKFNSSGAFVGAIGNSTSAGTCSAGGQSSWCTGGSFSTSSIDGGFSGPSGIIIDNSRDLIYISDTANARILKHKLSTGVYMGVIGGINSSSGTCKPNTSQRAWCTGGGLMTSLPNQPDGSFTTMRSMGYEYLNGRIYIGELFRVIRITP